MKNRFKPARSWANFRSTLLGLLAVLSIASHAGAQSPAPAAPAATGQGDGIEQLYQQISQFKKVVNSPPPASPDDPLPDTTRQPVLSGPGSVLPPSDPALSDADGIRRKLELLKSVMSQRASGDSPMNSPSTIPAAELPPAPTPPSDPVVSPTDPGPPPDNSAAQPRATPDFKMDESLIRTPVDALELAGSLFATGNYPLALKTWRSIDDQIADPHERQWLDYFVASSLRITGAQDEAAATYRELSSSGQSGYPVTAAAEWIKWIERRKRSEEVGNQVIAAIESLEMEFNNNEK